MNVHIERVLYFFSYSFSFIIHCILLILLFLIPLSLFKSVQQHKKSAPVFFQPSSQPQSNLSQAPAPQGVREESQNVQESRVQESESAPAQSLPDRSRISTATRAHSKSRWYKSQEESQPSPDIIRKNIADKLSEQCNNFLAYNNNLSSSPTPGHQGMTAQQSVDEFQAQVYFSKITRACKDAARFFSKTYYSGSSTTVNGIVTLIINRNGSLRSIGFDSSYKDEKINQIIKDFFSTVNIPPLPYNFEGDTFMYRIHGTIELRQGTNSITMRVHERD